MSAGGVADRQVTLGVEELPGDRGELVAFPLGDLGAGLLLVGAVLGLQRHEEDVAAGQLRQVRGRGPASRVRIAKWASAAATSGLRGSPDMAIR